jgi:hypothetical protein
MGELIEGSVARVEDQFTLIINRGSEHGVELGMQFAVMADGGDPIIDPETNEVIGELPTEKLRVQVFDVHPKYSRAETFRKYQPPPVKLPSFSALGGELASGSHLSGIGGMLGSDFAKQMIETGTFDSINKIIAAEMANPRPVRQQIANAEPDPPKESPVRQEVTVNIGDKVRQIVPEPGRVH